MADEQFVVLEGLIGRISGMGSRLIIVDLPLPAWHQQGSPYHADYRQRTRRLFGKFESLPGVQVVRLQVDNADNDFSDEVHPKPKVALGWSRQLAAVINGQGGDGSLLARQVRAVVADPPSVARAEP